MGSMNVNPVTPLITGASLTKTDSGGSTSSIFIVPTTAQSNLDFSKLSIVIENYSSTASCTVTPLAGDDYSAIGIGAGAAITVGTEATVILGGTQFESSRFQDEDGYFNFSLTTAATAYIYAIMPPGPIKAYS